MRSSNQHEIRPLRRAAAARVAVLHDEFVATEYEIYIPAGIWTHTAVRAFLDRPLRAEGGATNSAVNDRLLRFRMDHSWRLVAPSRVSIKAGEVQRQYRRGSAVPNVGVPRYQRSTFPTSSCG